MNRRTILLALCLPSGREIRVTTTDSLGADLLPAFSSGADTVAVILGLLDRGMEITHEEDGRSIAEIQDLPGCAGYGDTEAEAIQGCHVLALRVIADRLEHGETTIADSRAPSSTEPLASGRGSILRAGAPQGMPEAADLGAIRKEIVGSDSCETDRSAPDSAAELSRAAR